MSPRSKTFRSATDTPGSVAWCISFGDLLTLLLCFFLVLTPWDRLKARSNTSSSQSFSAQLVPLDQSGTTFASDLPLRRSIIVSELPVFKRNWSTVRADLGSLVDRGIGQEVVSAMFDDVQVELMVCTAEIDRAEILYSLEGAIRRVFRENVAVRYVVKGSCDGHGVLAPVTEAIIGRVRISGVQRLNG